MSVYSLQKKIPVEDVQVGMKLSKDIFTSSGLLLLKKGMILDHTSILKLKKYNFQFIYIEENCLIYETHTGTSMIKDTVGTLPQKTPIKDELFRHFHATYAENVFLIENIMKEIGQGNPLDLDYLFSLCNDMIEILECKKDLFILLHNLRKVDDYTYSHCVNVSLICNIFGRWLQLSQEELKNLTVAGLLHDIGKTQIELSILNKPSKLTTEEFEEIKKHTLYGYDLVKDQPIPEEIKMAILMHHEKFDGTGYPMALKDEEIHEFAKIVSIGDIYDAMTSTRSYRTHFSPFRVIQSFEQQSFGKLDTKYLLIFLQYIANYYVGDWVRLSSGAEGEIVFIHQNNLSRPIIRVNNKLIDLREQPNLWIEEVI